MQVAARISLFLVASALIGVAWVHFRHWMREGGRANASLVAAFGLLGIATAFYLASDVSGYESRALNNLGMYAFLGSGYAFLLHRDALVGLRRPTRILAGFGLAAAIGLGFAAPLPPGLFVENNAQFAVLLFQTAVWTAFVGEPAYRAWAVARGRPMVQRARLRAISLGYVATILLVLLYMAVSSLDPTTRLSTDVLLFIAVPVIPALVLLYAGFLPPRILRSWWRAREERALVEAAPPLFYAGDRSTLADRALNWAVRLVGADQGCIVLPGDPTPICHGIDAAGADELLEQTGVAPQAPLLVTLANPPRRALAVPLHLEAGTGTLAVVAGPFTPSFEGEELQTVAHYASSVAAAFDQLSLNEVRDGFLTAVSHEFRTPLTSILGISATLALQNDSISERHRSELMERLQVNTSRLDRMLSDLLDIDRLARGGLHLRPQETDLAEMVRTLLNSVGALRGRVVQFSAETVTALLDPPHVQRAVEHLLVNAVEHTPPGTKIWVRVEDTDDGAVVIVEDDGDGLPVEVRNHVFEPFRQGSNIKSHAPGIGIGLSYVSRIAERHGGRAWMEERNGGGSSFRILFPQTPPSND